MRRRRASDSSGKRSLSITTLSSSFCRVVDERCVETTRLTEFREEFFCLRRKDNFKEMPVRDIECVVDSIGQKSYEIDHMIQGRHHNGDQAARRPHIFCSFPGRRFEDLDKESATFIRDIHYSTANRMRHVDRFGLSPEHLADSSNGDFWSLVSTENRPTL